MSCFMCKFGAGILVVSAVIGSMLATGTNHQDEPGKTSAPASPPASAPAEKPAQPASTSPASTPAQGAAPSAAPEGAEVTPYVLGFTMNRIDGTPQDLSAYKGKVVLMVNVASKCGYTPQYESLEKVYARDKDKGLVVLGFPANDFGKQEPGTNKEIAEFCASTYKVGFPMFEKISVKGSAAHPLYQRLAAQPAPIGGEPKWNFTKFLVDREGNVVARFDSNVKPDGPEITKKLSELLGATPKTN